MAFHLLTWAYFNDANVGRNILIISSQLKRILFRGAYIKYVEGGGGGGEGGGVTNFSKTFRSPEDHGPK